MKKGAEGITQDLSIFVFRICEVYFLTLYRNNILIHIQQVTTLHSLFSFIWKLLYIFRVVLPPIISSAYNFIYSI
jgi:hypothetical protein